MQLSPYESFPIVRYIKDPTETATLYVQAKIYESSTHALLDTVNLDVNGSDSHWFSKTWQVPHDSAYGSGRHIVIITTVYTDSGYTTKAAYEEETTDYLVQQRWNQTLGSGGGGSIDERTIKKVFKEVLESEEKPKGLELKDIVSGVIEAMKFPEHEKMDMSPLLSALEKISGQLASQPKPKEPDFSPLEKKLNEVIGALRSMGNDHAQGTKEHEAGMKTLVSEVADFRSELKKMNAEYRDINSSFQNIVDGISSIFSAENKKQKRGAYLQKLLNGIR